MRRDGAPPAPSRSPARARCSCPTRRSSTRRPSIRGRCTGPGGASRRTSTDDDAVYELTVQDQPLNIAMESLLWQEDLTRPPRVLGAEAGFATNRSQVE